MVRCCYQASSGQKEALSRGRYHLCLLGCLLYNVFLRRKRGAKAVSVSALRLCTEDYSQEMGVCGSLKDTFLTSQILSGNGA